MLTLTTLLLAGVTIALPSEVRVRGNELHLGAIATVRGDDAALAQRLGALSIGHAPAPGYTRTLQRWQLAERIQSACPDASISWSGAEVCRILPEVERVRGATIQSAAQRELATVFGEREVTIAPQTPIADLDVPLGASGASLRASIAKRELRGGAWSVPVEIQVDGVVYQTVWVAFQVELFDLVPVLVRDVRRGELFGADLIETRRQRIAVHEASSFLGPEKLIGATATRDLAAGSSVIESDVKRAQLVRQGDTVELSVSKGPITARASATALQSGSIGDKVRVSTGERGRAITGVVTGRNLVEVDLSDVRSTTGGLP